MQGNISDLVRTWTDGTFCMRSGYYAGRRPSEGDLGSRHLEMLYQGIRKDVGVEGAANFVRFVNKLDDLAASSFIVAFEQFWAEECKVIDISQKPGDRMRLDARGDALLSQGFGAIMSAMADRGSGMDHRHLSLEVKARFIKDHLTEIPEDERRVLQGSGYSFV